MSFVISHPPRNAQLELLDDLNYLSRGEIKSVDLPLNLTTEEDAGGLKHLLLATERRKDGVV
jgi:hypothetical protein